MAAMNGSRISTLLLTIITFVCFLLTYPLEVAGASNVGVGGSSTCDQMTIKMCEDVLPYNTTKFGPKFLAESQVEAKLQLNSFQPLIDVACSSQLKFFLCSVFAPMCTPEVPVSIGPCRPLCQSVKRRCEPMLSQFGFPWPAFLNCSLFPLENSVASMCMKGPEGEAPSSTHVPVNTGPPRSISCQHNKLSDRYIYVNRTASCSLRCGSDGLFGAEDKYLAETMVFALALATFSLGLLSLFVKCRSGSVQYPETPILFVAVCFGCGSVAYMIRWFGGRAAISCVEYTGAEILVVSGLQQIRCTIVGILLYFFTVASRLWWLIVCWCCFMSVGLGLSTETLNFQQFWYHVFAWGLSVVMVVVSLVQKAIDADELTGMCYIGQQSGNENSLFALLILPEVLISVCGALLLLMVVFFNSRNSKHNRGWSGIEGEWSMTVFVAAFYLPFAAILIICYFYEFYKRKDWTEVAGPKVEIFLLKIAITFSYGLVSGAWIVLRKWCCLCSSRFNPRKPPTTAPSIPVTREPMIPTSKSNSKYWVDL